MGTPGVQQATGRDWRMKQQEDMVFRNKESEQADDVATLYSWANLHGAKYRDFSASRQEMRTQMRQRAIAEQARLEHEQGREGVAAAQQPERREEHAIWEDLLPDAEERLTPPATVTRSVAELRPAITEAPRYELPTPLPGNDGSPMRRSSGLGIEPAPLARRVSAQGIAQAVDQAEAQRYAPPMRDQEQAPQKLESGRLDRADRSDRMDRSAQPERFEPAQPAGPAWLTERSAAVPAPMPESLQQSRERVAARWFALQGVFGGEAKNQPVRSEQRLPVMAVFSLAGGVGKTSIIAGLGRALAARGERVLMADASSFGLLPFYFGARDIKPGVLRTFSGAPADPPIRMLTLNMEADGGDPDFIRREITRNTQDVGRVLIDMATGSAAALVQTLRLAPTILVPVVPDMASVVTLQSLDSFFRSQESVAGKPVQPWYVLNQFDPSLPLHLDVREVLRQQLGDRLLPFALQRRAAISEALAEGMTVMDYAPGSPAAEDLMNLVTWVRNTSVAAAGARGLRWSER